MKDSLKTQVTKIVSIVSNQAKSWSTVLQSPQNYINSKFGKNHSRSQSNEIEEETPNTGFDFELQELTPTKKILEQQKPEPLIPEIESFRKKYLALVDEARSLMQAVQINKIYFSDKDYPLLLERLQKIINEDVVEIIHQTSNNIVALDKILSKTQYSLKNYRSIFYFNISPDKVYAYNRFYNHPIKRGCYRGDGRPPTTKEGDGIFQLGFTKKKTTASYIESIQNKLTNYKEDVKVYYRLCSNQATSIAVSRSPYVAAYFPIFHSYDHLKTTDVIEAVSCKLNYNILSTYNDLKKSLDNLAAKNAESPVYNLTVKNLLQKVLNDFSTPDDFLNTIEQELIAKAEMKDITWLYLVCVDKGFDVHSRGYLAPSFWKINKNCLYAQEICTDEIPSHHVLAAIPIMRDFSKCQVIPTSLIQDAIGKAYFSIIGDIQYNETALEYFAEKNIDIEKYKLMLQQFFAKKEIKMELAVDGYNKNEAYEPSMMKEIDSEDNVWQLEL